MSFRGLSSSGSSQKERPERTERELVQPDILNSYNALR